jgi:uncharacterized protein (DUF305 family)
VWRCAHPSIQHNAADVTFAQNMIPQHQQAVDMAAMVLSHTANRDVIVMAKHISARSAPCWVSWTWCRALGDVVTPARTTTS